MKISSLINQRLNEGMKDGSLISNLKYTLGSTGLILIAGLLVSVIAGRFLSQSEFGSYNILVNLVLVSVTLSLFGCNSSLLHFGGSKKIDQYVVLFRSLLIVVPISFFLFLLVNISQDGISKILGFVYGEGLVAVSLIVPLFCVNRLFLAHFRSINNIRLFAILESGRAVLLFVLTLLFLLFSSKLMVAIYALLLCEIIILITSSLLLYKNYQKDSALQSTSLYEIVRFSSHLAIASIMIEVELRYGFFIIGGRVGHDEVAVFSIAFMLAQMLLVIPGAIEKTVSPAISRLFFEGRKQELELLIQKVVVYVIVILTNVFLFLLYFYPAIVELLFPAKPALKTGVFLFALLGLGFLLRGIFASIASVFTCMGKPEIYSKIIPLRLILNIMIALLLWGYYGHISVALGLVGSSVVVTMLLFYYLREVSGVKLPALRIILCLVVLVFIIYSVLLGNAGIVWYLPVILGFNVMLWSVLKLNNYLFPRTII